MAPRLGRPCTVAAYASRPFFQGYEKLRIETEIFRKTMATFWGRSGVPPVVAPEGGSAFAEGKAERTSALARIRSLEGPEGSQK